MKSSCDILSSQVVWNPNNARDVEVPSSRAHGAGTLCRRSMKSAAARPSSTRGGTSGLGLFGHRGR